MRGPISSRSGALVALIAWLAAVLAGAVAPAAAPADPRLAAFLAAGGTLADICGEAGHGSGGERHCGVCLYLGPALLPEAAVAAGVRVALAAGQQARATVGPRVAVRLANAPRAPPGRS